MFGPDKRFPPLSPILTFLFSKKLFLPKIGQEGICALKSLRGRFEVYRKGRTPLRTQGGPTYDFDFDFARRTGLFPFPSFSPLANWRPKWEPKSGFFRWSSFSKNFTNFAPFNFCPNFSDQKTRKRGRWRGEEQINNFHIDTKFL